MRLTGHDAIEYAERTGWALNKFEDPTEVAREGLTVREAREIAKMDPSLIWINTEEDEINPKTDATTWRIESLTSDGQWELEPNGDGFMSESEAEEAVESLIETCGYDPSKLRVVKN